MSRRIHYGSFQSAYIYAYIFCLEPIETWYDWQSLSHYDMTLDENKVTCRKCRSDFDKIKYREKEASLYVV